MGKILHNSRKQANFLRRLGKDVRDMEHVKHFIASCNINEFIKFVHITRVSDDFREIEYEVRLPKTEMSNCVNCGKSAAMATEVISRGIYLHEDEGEWVCSSECLTAVEKERSETDYFLGT